MKLHLFSVRLVGSLLVVFLCVLTALAQKEKNEAPASKALLLKVPVWVETGEKEYWVEGKRQSFKVFFDEQEVLLKGLQGPTSSTVFLVVFDLVADITRVEIARNAINEAFKVLPENYWIGLMSGQDGLGVLQEPTANRSVVAEKVAALQVNGRAGLLDALEPVAALALNMQRKANVRVNVLYVTDSGVANYRADMLNPVINSSDAGDLSRRFADRAVQERMSRLAQSMSEFAIPTFVLHLEYRGDTLNLAYQSGLERIANDSGGQALFCRTNDEIATSLDLLLARMRNSYLLNVEVPKLKRDSAKLRVTAQDPAGQPFERVKHANQIAVPKK